MKGNTKEDKDMSEGLCRNLNSSRSNKFCEPITHVTIWTNIPIVSLIFFKHSLLPQGKKVYDSK